MNLIVGMLVVMGCVRGGFAVHGGQLLALWQPSEVLIIVGAATGAFIVGNPVRVSKRALAGIGSLPWLQSKASSLQNPGVFCAAALR